MATKEETGTEIDVTTKMPSTAQLREITSIEDAVRLMQDEFNAEIVNASDLGDGFSMLGEGKEAKDPLVGKPCFFVSWNFSTGDYGEFVSARVVVEIAKGQYAKYVANDGSTGMCAQLREFTMRTGRAQGLFAPNGLRKSEYEHPEHGHGITYYIDTSGIR